MPRTPRTRTLAEPFTGSRSEYIDGVWQSTTVNTITRNSSCYDYIGRPVDDSPLTIKRERGCVRLDGSFVSTYQVGGARKTTFTNYPLKVGYLTGTATPISPPSGWGLDVIARTNPSRPVVTPFTLLQDIVELPRMLSQAVSLLGRPWKHASPKGAASTYLGTVFGWMPLVDDIKKLLDLQSYADKRCQELNRLYSARGLKRRIEMGNSNVVVADQVQTSGAGSAILTYPFSVTYTKTAWATIRWKPANNVPYDPSTVAVNKLARQVVSGMTSEGLLKGLWDVLPWTWMINWFTNVGKYALAHSNTVPAVHSKPCFMSKTEVSYVAGVPYTQGIKTNSVKMTCDESFSDKRRYVSGSSAPGCYVPFLDTFRLSVLGSLAIQRMR